MQISVINVVDTIDLAHRFILSWQVTVLNTKLWIKESMFYKQLNVNVEWYLIIFFGKNNAHIFHFVKSGRCHEKWNIIEFYSWNKV